MALAQVGDAYGLLAETALSGGNVLVAAAPAAARPSCQRLVSAGRYSNVRRYRVYFGMSLKRADESFPDLVSHPRALNGRGRHLSLDVFNYFARSGSVVCTLDGIDEAATEQTLAGFVELFSELAQVLSAESTVVMSSVCRSWRTRLGFAGCSMAPRFCRNVSYSTSTPKASTR